MLNSLSNAKYDKRTTSIDSYRPPLADDLSTADIITSLPAVNTSDPYWYNDTFGLNASLSSVTSPSVSMETEVSFGLDAASWNIWAVVTLILVFCTATGNILVCLAISWEKRLQNVTNYFLMSLAITDLMVAVLVMPLGILTLVREQDEYLEEDENEKERRLPEEDERGEDEEKKEEEEDKQGEEKRVEDKIGEEKRLEEKQQEEEEEEEDAEKIK
ncbi:hypothetical protein M8J75_007021 [Diaphorina citri]|nr:hypothetical protein M8J75_007021 [Diaphorina citri]